MINFDHSSRSIRKARHIDTQGLNLWEQHHDHKAHDVINTIYRTNKEIAKQCSKSVSPGTWWNGLSVLVKIGKAICLAPSDHLTLGAHGYLQPELRDWLRLTNNTQ